MTRGDQRDRARAKNLKKQLDTQAGGNSQLKHNEKNMNIVCKVCRQAFFVTTSETQLREHVDIKHPKLDYPSCFS